MAKVQYKKETGILHIGGGRFFNAQTPVEVKDAEIRHLLNTYVDLEDATQDDGSQGDENPDEGYTEASLKKMNAEQQKDIIEVLGGDVSETNKQDERIALILELQEKQEGE